jgi:5-methylcytosine-specific restriction endonuclease McrA
MLRYPMQAYETALRSRVADDPDDPLRYRRLMDAPPDKAERDTALNLAIEYLGLLDCINGRGQPLEHAPGFDEEARIMEPVLKEIQRLQKQIVIRFRRVDRLNELRAMPYREYLRTPEWRARREQALDRAGWRCQFCNSTASPEVHHRTYERRGEEAAEDLTVVCATCHAHFHEHHDLAR